MRRAASLPSCRNLQQDGNDFLLRSVDLGRKSDRKITFTKIAIANFLHCCRRDSWKKNHM